jgi:hypothetical protein
MPVRFIKSLARGGMYEDFLSKVDWLASATCASISTAPGKVNQPSFSKVAQACPVLAGSRYSPKSPNSLASVHTTALAMD